MDIAFYAPMKPPDDPVISGDRETARLILKALDADGHTVSLASRLRAWQRTPDPEETARIRSEASRETDRLLDLYERDGAPDIWITYHLYHKAPDCIGPAVSTALGIPYVVLEGCRAKKRATGPWADLFAAADRALLHADAVAALHAEDAEGLDGFLKPDRLHRLPPFIDATRFDKARAARPKAGPPATTTIALTTVAMMRAGDKEASYRLLADALSRLAGLDWRLRIAGDGPHRDQILALFPADRIDWHGALAPDDIPGFLGRGDMFVWPAINEAFGVALMEAQAAGLPVVAGDSGGVPDIVLNGRTGLVVPEGDVGAFSEAIAVLIGDPARRNAYSTAAADHVRARHDLSAGRLALARILAFAKAVHRGKA